MLFLRCCLNENFALFFFNVDGVGGYDSKLTQWKRTVYENLDSFYLKQT